VPVEQLQQKGGAPTTPAVQFVPVVPVQLPPAPSGTPPASSQTAPRP